MRFLALAALAASALVLAGCDSCNDPAKTNPEGGGATTASDAGVAARPKSVDLDKCDAGVQEMERIAKGATKTCTSSAECTEWIRNGNCGSIPVARPFPPSGSESRWRELSASVDLTCPDQPKCKWASLGVECRAGACAPSLEGRFDPYADAGAP